MWLWRAAVALVAAADAAAARAAAAAGCNTRALKAGLGTVLAMVALHRLLTQRRAPGRSTGGAVASAVAPPTGSHTRSAAAALPARTAPAPPAAAAGLAVSRVSVATPGALFAGRAGALQPGTLQLAPRADSALGVLCAVADVFLITQLPPGEDAGAAEAAALKALSAAGVLGAAPGAVPPHRALFCTTDAGRIALVRQLGADVHVDGSPEAVRELARFGTRLVQVLPDAAEAAEAARVPGVHGAPSLKHWVDETWPGL